MRITIKSLSHQFGATPVLKNVNLDIQEKELFFLLGPSGCGKTTLLRLIAGFYTPSQGEIWFGDKLINTVPPQHRNTGMVFQNYALWPHMTVAQNVAYGLDLRAIGPSDKKSRVAEALHTVQMSPFSERTPNQLSGGQQQRVALARALVIKPDLLLLDEPLSNLDAKLRLEMREEIRRIHAETQITTVYVTHDQKEALSLADRMAVMVSGQVRQVDSPRSVYRAPIDKFVADFIGETNWIEANCTPGEIGFLNAQTSLGTFQVPRKGAMFTGDAWLGFRPEAFQIGASERNSFTAGIASTSYLGEIEQYLLRTPAGLIKVFEQNPSRLREPGEKLSGFVLPHDLLIFPKALS